MGFGTQQPVPAYSDTSETWEGQSTGASPMDAVYHELKSHSRNAHQLDQAVMIAGASPLIDVSHTGDFYLTCIGDAAASRNIHAALYDAQRVLCYQ